MNTGVQAIPAPNIITLKTDAANALHFHMTISRSGLYFAPLNFFFLLCFLRWASEFAAQPEPEPEPYIVGDSTAPTARHFVAATTVKIADKIIKLRRRIFHDLSPETFVILTTLVSRLRQLIIKLLSVTGTLLSKF